MTYSNDEVAPCPTHWLLPKGCYIAVIDDAFRNISPLGVRYLVTVFQILVGLYQGMDVMKTSVLS